MPNPIFSTRVPSPRQIIINTPPVSPNQRALTEVNRFSKKKIASPFKAPAFSGLAVMARVIESYRRKERLKELLEKNKIRLENIKLFKIKLYFFIFNANINSQRNLFLRYYTPTFFILKQVLARLIR